MFGSDILEVIAGMIFIFVLICTLCTVVKEALEAWLKTRAAYLEHGIRELLQDKEGKGLVSALFNHPLVYGLFNGPYTPGKPRDKLSPWRGGKNLPSYIPSRNFALAIMDIAAHGPAHGTNANPSPAQLPLAQLRDNVRKIGNPAVQRALLTAVDTANGDLDRVRANIEAWYDSAMDRVSGWYRRSAQWVLFWVALVLTISLNLNSLTMADYLYRHAAERGAIVSAAGHASADPKAGYEAAHEALNDLHLPIGWTQDWAPLPHSTPAQTSKPSTRQAEFLIGLWPSWQSSIQNLLQNSLQNPWHDIFQPLIGWLITAFAATLGAPFWFDILNKVMVIRSTVKPE
jgi:hypothetical protein